MSCQLCTILGSLVNDYYDNVTRKHTETIPSDNNVNFQKNFITQQTGSGFSFQPLSVTLVYNLLKKLSTSKATGWIKFLLKF